MLLVENRCGNTATADQTITLVDTVAPSFASFPAPATVACVTGSLLPEATGTPQGTDGCGQTHVEHTDQPAENDYEGQCGGEYRFVRTWTVIDGYAPVRWYVDTGGST